MGDVFVCFFVVYTIICYTNFHRGGGGASPPLLLFFFLGGGGGRP